MNTRLAASGIVFAILAYIAWPIAAGAQAPDCSAAETQADMTQCAADAYKAADVKLNASYKALTELYADDADAKQALVAAQRAWIAFRDAECNFATVGSEDGSIYPFVLAECQRALTEARTQQLDGYRNCPEGEVTCP